VSKSLNKLKSDDQTARFPFLVLAVSILLTVGITYNFYQSAKNKDLIRFNSEVNRIHLAIENKINLYVALLKGGRGFVESNQEINRVNFSEYVKSLEIKKNYAGVQGIGFAQVIAADQREALLKKMNSEGYADFKIFPATEKDFYQVIVYLEPLDELNQKVIGFDLGSEANRREALERSRDSGEAASTAKITLLQETDVNRQSGFLIFLPIYKNGKLSATVEERNKNIIGYIYSPFRAGSSKR
jgi:CHASE1-domain containing sensor protein